MAIGGGKRKWRNVVAFVGSLAAAAGGELSGYRRDRRRHGDDERSREADGDGKPGGGRDPRGS